MIRQPPAATALVVLLVCATLGAPTPALASARPVSVSPPEAVDRHAIQRPVRPPGRDTAGPRLTRDLR
ncbi:MAG TPA: hypothetical protein VIV06_10955, partial [Candidatus Limnocylindrales bacterium]